jgi:PAS domain S-box-containing protein
MDRLPALALIGAVLAMIPLATGLAWWRAARCVRSLRIALRDTEARVAMLETALGDAKAEAAAILDAAVDGIIISDEDGTIRSFNHAAERIFGYSSRQMTGRNIRILMKEPDQSEQDLYIASGKAAEQPRIIGVNREVTGRRRDGSTFPMDLTVGENRSDGRRLFADIIRDVSEKKRSEELFRQSEESFRLLVDNVHDYAINWLDTKGRIATWNLGAERI